MVDYFIYIIFGNAWMYFGLWFLIPISENNIVVKNIISRNAIMPALAGLLWPFVGLYFLLSFWIKK